MFSLNPEDTRAILIGASEFEDKNLSSLPAIKDNNVKLRTLLCEVVGMSKDNIHILEDRDYSNQITLEIKKIAAKGLDIIYYAGHGLPHSKQLYLATKKTELDDPKNSGALFADDLLQVIINKNETKRIIFIFDCCFSGFARENIDTKGKEVFLLTATSSVETANSESPENDNYTAFTHEFLVILEQGIENVGKILTLQDIFSCLKERLKNKNLPLPQITSYGSPNELGICKNQASQNISLKQRNDVQTPTPTEKNTSMPTSMSSIALYNRLKQLPKPLFNEICFYLKEKYGYDLSHIDLDKVPSESANQLIEFIEQYPQGLNHLQEALEDNKVAKIRDEHLIPFSQPNRETKAQSELKIKQNATGNQNVFSATGNVTVNFNSTDSNE